MSQALQPYPTYTVDSKGNISVYLRKYGECRQQKQPNDGVHCQGAHLEKMPIVFRIALCAFEYFIIIKKIYMWYDIETVSLVPFR